MSKSSLVPPGVSAVHLVGRLSQVTCEWSTRCECLRSLYLAHLARMPDESFVNSYQPSPPIIPKGVHGKTPVDQYDFNYCFEVKTLRSDRVELRPFVVGIKASLSHLPSLTQPAVTPR